MSKKCRERGHCTILIAHLCQHSPHGCYRLRTQYQSDVCFRVIVGMRREQRPHLYRIRLPQHFPNIPQVVREPRNDDVVSVQKRWILTLPTTNPASFKVLPYSISQLLAAVLMPYSEKSSFAHFAYSSRSGGKPTNTQRHKSEPHRCRTQ